MGRTHRPFYRVCAIDRHSPRDGRILEELGTYDTSVADTDARVVLKKDRIDYWLSVGAQPSDRMAVLIKKYGSSGTHVEKQQQALQILAEPKQVPDPGPPASLAKKAQEAKAAEPAAQQKPPQDETAKPQEDAESQEKSGSQEKGEPKEEAKASSE
jgi:small subunit ribosomal protein S16